MATQPSEAKKVIIVVASILLLALGANLLTRLFWRGPVSKFTQGAGVLLEQHMFLRSPSGTYQVSGSSRTLEHLYITTSKGSGIIQDVLYRRQGSSAWPVWICWDEHDRLWVRTSPEHVAVWTIEIDKPDAANDIVERQVTDMSSLPSVLNGYPKHPVAQGYLSGAE